MRTARVLTVSPSMICTRGVCSGGCTWSGRDVRGPGGVPGLGGVPSLGGVPGPGGCTWSRGLPAHGGTCSVGVYLVQGGVPGPGEGVCVCLLPGRVPGPRAVSGTRPPVNRMTNRCKNITLPQTSFAGGNNCHYYCLLVHNAKGMTIIVYLFIMLRVCGGLKLTASGLIHMPCSPLLLTSMFNASNVLYV